MKRHLYIGYLGLLFLIFSCKSPTESEPEGCDGVSGSGLVFDECGVCGGENFGEDTYIDDICGICSVNLWDECYNIEETTSLSLSTNGLTGEIPSEIGNLTNLTELNLGLNQLTGEIPSELGNLNNLTVLRLYYNDLTGEIPSEIGNLYNLTFITLRYNQLSGEIPQQVCNLIENNNLYLPFITDGNNLTNTCEN